MALVRERERVRDLDSGRAPTRARSHEHCLMLLLVHDAYVRDELVLEPELEGLVREPLAHLDPCSQSEFANVGGRDAVVKDEVIVATLPQPRALFPEIVEGAPVVPWMRAIETGFRSPSAEKWPAIP